MRAPDLPNAEDCIGRAASLVECCFMAASHLEAEPSGALQEVLERAKDELRAAKRYIRPAEDGADAD